MLAGGGGVPELMRCVLLCLLEAVKGALSLLEVLNALDVQEVMCRVPLCLLEVLDVQEVMRRLLLCMLEAMEGELHLLEVLEVVRCMLRCILEAAEGGLCLREVVEAPEVMRCVPLCMQETVNGGLSAGGVGRVGCAGGDALCAALYVGERGG